MIENQDIVMRHFKTCS